MNALCIVVKAFPRLSETFVTRELEALQDSGLFFQIASLRAREKTADLVTHNVSAPVTYLPEYLHAQPVRVWRAWTKARGYEGYGDALRAFRADAARDLTRNRFRRFGQACVLAAELPDNIRHLHAHFAHTPASVARYAAMIRRLSLSISAHAKDIWTTPDWELRDKLVSSRFVSVCNSAGFDRLKCISPAANIHLWPHLLETNSSPAPALSFPAGEGNAAGPGMPAIAQRATAEGEALFPNTIRLITVARAVPKKGLTTLLDALALLPPEPHWTWTHIGGGPDLGALKARAGQHPFSDRLTLSGPQPHAHVIEALRQSDIFILPALVADDGDRDGRPNALLEAMSAGLACIGTPVGGIPEIIADGRDGLVSEPGAGALAQTIGRLMSDAAARARIGAAAQIRTQSLADQGRIAIDALAAALKEACRS
jgi:glycosyltransferase involved in cell wall biosynthesis